MLKEYIQLMILDYLSTSLYVTKIIFIGGTNLRLIHGIDRFSEDLDFDCKNLNQSEFLQMTDDILVFLQRTGFFFPFPVPPDAIICAMKLSALLSRKKGRDFYDALFLLGQTEPDYGYLAAKCNIHNRQELKIVLNEVIAKINIEQKSHDFEHLLFNKANLKKVSMFSDFIATL